MKDAEHQLTLGEKLVGFTALLVFGATLALAFSAWQMIAFESADLLLNGSVETHRIVRVEVEPNPDDPIGTATLHFRRNGHSLQVIGPPGFTPGNEIHILINPARGSLRRLPHGDNWFSRMMVFFPSLLLAIPFLAAFFSGFTQIRRLFRFASAQWAQKNQPYSAAERASDILDHAAFVTFAVAALVLWIMLCLRVLFIILESKEPSVLSTGMPFIIFSALPFVPIIEWLCRLRKSRYWDPIEHAVFIFVMGSLLVSIVRVALASPASGKTTGEAILKLLKGLFGT